MRISISHAISYSYVEPARHITQILRLTPRDHDGQHVLSWRLEPTIDGRLRSSRDAYGNIVQSFSADGPITELSIHIDGEIETSDLAGVLRGNEERLSPEIFLRDTPLATADDALKEFARNATRNEATQLARMHALMETLHEEMTCVEANQRGGLGAALAFSTREGIAQDLAHVFMACARELGTPARYVSGYAVGRPEAPDYLAGAHAWAEAYLDDYGWIGFDAALGLCPTDGHVRVASGLDFSDAAPIRGARAGGDGETLSVVVSANEMAAARRGGQ